jgi:hypothetical protein
MPSRRRRTVGWNALGRGRRAGILAPACLGCLLAVPSIVSALTGPEAGQIDLELSNLVSFPNAGSAVRVRENHIEGTRLRFRDDLGIDTVSIPELWLSWWIDGRNALQLQLRGFIDGGSAFLSEPILYNGATVAAGQRISAGASPWISVGLYYERLLLGDAASDLRAKAGLSYTFLNFDLGNPRLAPGTVGHETTEDFVTQELPIPTLGFEARRRLTDRLSCEGLLLANWLNNVNSLRREGGTVYLSQTEVQAHGRLVYTSAADLGPVQPFFGIGYVYYRQRETSHEDGNFIRLSSVGPEFGLRISF